jgi:hypothetical protein
MSTQEEFTLNSTLVTAVLELIDFYSKKGVFKINEYKDIATITERLTEVKTGYDNDKEFTALNLSELAFIIQIFKEGTQRIPTAIDSFGQIFAVYQHFNKFLEQEVEKEKNKEESVPSVEELN